jgi:hypothetical protein
VVRRTIAHLTLFGAHGCAERAAPLKQLKARPADDLVATKPEERLGAAVPRADFAGVGDRECRVRGVFEEVEEVAVGDRRHRNHLRNA